MDLEAEFSSSHNHIPEDITSTQMSASSPLGKPQGNNLSTWGGSHMNSNYSYLPNMSAYGNSPNSVFGQVNFSYAVGGRGRGGRHDNVLHPQLYSHYEFGHGSGHYPKFRRAKGRSVGSNLSARPGPSGRSKNDWNDPVSAEERPDLYYDKEMLEDPWKGMTRVIWDGPPSNKSQLLKSTSVKKARTSSEDSRKSISQPSLAEHLAASFDENVEEPEGHEEFQRWSIQTCPLDFFHLS